jgi:hypothetical protein
VHRPHRIVRIAELFLPPLCRYFTVPFMMALLHMKPPARWQAGGMTAVLQGSCFERYLNYERIRQQEFYLTDILELKMFWRHCEDPAKNPIPQGSQAPVLWNLLCSQRCKERQQSMYLS